MSDDLNWDVEPQRTLLSTIDFTPNEGQAAALDKLQRWINLEEFPALTLPKELQGVFNDDPEDYFVLKGWAGTGKEQPLSATVQTPNGPRRFGDLQVGDRVLGRNGKATKVTGVFPQGVKPVYRVTFRDGTQTRCGLDHLWKVDAHTKRKPSRVMSLREIMNKGVRFKSGGYRYQVPLCEPVEYDTGSPRFPAYVIGALIGDGALTGSTPALCTPDLDHDIADRVTGLLTEGFKVRKRTEPACPQYVISDTLHYRSNRLTNHLRDLGLTVRSAERFIPAEYLYAPVRDRWELLRGLMDTDGSAGGNRVQFHTKSTRLARDVITLVQSLGGTATLRTSDRGEKGTEYSVNVKVTDNPFHSLRKSAMWKRSSKNPPSRYIVDIQEDGMEEQMCIMVEDPEHLYLTDNFIVTHNTTIICYLIAWLHDQGKRVAVAAPTNKAVSVLECKVDEFVKGAFVHAEFASIHSFVGLRMVEGEDGEHKITQSGYSRLHEYDVVIIDECSMVDRAMLFPAIQQCRQSCLVIFVGDSAQLPPVGEAKDSLTFSLPLGYTLDKITRQAEGNPLIQASMKVREFIAKNERVEASDLASWLPDAMIAGNKRMVQEAIALQKAGKDARILAYRNRTVIGYNELIHYELYPKATELFVPGERVVVQQRCPTLNLNTGESHDLRTSEELEVVTVRSEAHTDYRDVSCWTMVLKDDVGRELLVHVPKGMQSFNRKAGKLFEEASEIKSKMQRSGGRQYEELKMAYKDALASAWAFKKAFCEIRHTYAMTAHKSQGSTFDVSLVDLADIQAMNSTFEMSRSLYVCITRPREYTRISY